MYLPESLRGRFASRFASHVGACVVVCLAASSRAQDGGGPLYINEILAENDSQGPLDVSGGTADMVEIFNASDQLITLGAPSADASYYLSDTAAFDPLTAWRFKIGTTVLPRSRVVIFCDNNALDGVCEPHALFGIDSDGTEPVSLWGPIPQGGGDRPLLDQIWLPPMRSDVSFGRFPDGAGPAPVPVEETLAVLRFYPRDTSTFGTCANTGVPCAGAIESRVCTGAANGEGGTLEPRVRRESFSTNRPAADEPVVFQVRVDDEKVPDEQNIARVEIRYAVNGEEREPVPLQFTGLLDGKDAVPPRPLDIWSIWEGEIPGQAAGAVVTFSFYVEDADGLSSLSPRDLCPSGVGPCDDVGLPGPSCALDPPQEGQTGRCYLACDGLNQYVAGFEPAEPFFGLLINEVVPVQTRVLEDREEPRCPADGDPFCRFDDFIELCNNGSEAVDLSGLWLSDRPFQPQHWRFPEGSTIGPGEYLIVWCDDDGGKCPRPDEKVSGDCQDCPDPTDAARGEYHTNFALDRAGEQIYLLQEREAGGFGVLHGLEFGVSDDNVAWSLTPDCSRSGDFVATIPSPRAPNPTVDVEPRFLRGDANSDCTLNLTDPTFTLNFLFLEGPTPACLDAADADDTGDVVITDAVYVLTYLFLEGPEPPAPGPTVAGSDPTDDLLADCEAPDCGG